LLLPPREESGLGLTEESLYVHDDVVDAEPDSPLLRLDEMSWRERLLWVECRSRGAQGDGEPVTSAIGRLLRPQRLDDLFPCLRLSSCRHEHLEQVTRLLRLPLGGGNLLAGAKDLEAAQGLNRERRRLLVAEQEERTRGAERSVANAELSEFLT